MTYDFFENVVSPCVNICMYNESGEYCIGCKRTPIEISKWFTMTNSEREKILSELPKREVNTEY